MITKTVTIKNPTGLHLRPAGVLCNLANQFDSRVEFQVGDEIDIYNAKSIICVLGAGVKGGDRITITCTGSDEETAVEQIVKRIEEGLVE